MSIPLRIRGLLTVLSGASVMLIGYFLDDILGAVGRGLTGAVFGLLVLVPFVGAKTWWYGRVCGLVVGSVLIYALVVELAVDGYGPLDLDPAFGVVVSGVLGALLVGALTGVVAPLPVSARYWMYVAAAGVLGGFLFSLLYESNYLFVVSAGFVAWQLPVFVALHSATR